MDVVKFDFSHAIYLETFSPKSRQHSLYTCHNKDDNFYGCIGIALTSFYTTAAMQCGSHRRMAREIYMYKIISLASKQVVLEDQKTGLKIGIRWLKKLQL